MIYYTGDIHGSKFEIVKLAKRYNLTRDDIIVILGDAGINYFSDERDRRLKEVFAQLKPTIFCIHGNHEIRPANLSSYITKEWNNGTVWYEEAYPNILFAKDGEIYDMEGIKHLVIGGAYSVDKFYRISRGYGWWADEQPSKEIKEYVERRIKEKEIDIILSHTCPYKYEPREMFISGIDQSTVDTSTEMWLDKIEETVDYKAWYCGHWHTNKRIDKMHFLYHGVETSDDVKRIIEGVEKNMKVFFTGDLHFGHENVLKFDNRPFETVEEMDAELIRRWNNKVSKGDLVYVLGDMIWKTRNDDAPGLIKSLNGQIILIKGNHDRFLHNAKAKSALAGIKDYDDICVTLEDGTVRRCILSHYFIPMYNGHRYQAIHLHAHSHFTDEADFEVDFAEQLNQMGCRNEIYNAGCMYWNYEPVTLDEMIAHGKTVRPNYGTYTPERTDENG